MILTTILSRDKVLRNEQIPNSNEFKVNITSRFSTTKLLINKLKCELRKSEHHNITVPYMAILVHSHPSDFQIRQAARGTWAHADERAKTYFLLGVTETQSDQNAIEQEDAEYKDIIQGDFIDSKMNESYKHIMGLKWITENCDNVKYVIKMDNDVFINVPNVYNYLQSNQQKTEFLMGCFINSDKTPRAGDYALTDEEYPPEYLPSKRNDKFRKFYLSQNIFYCNVFQTEFQAMQKAMQSYTQLTQLLIYIKSL